MINWNNIDLKSSYERDLNLIDALSFDTLLLEIACNIRDINPQTVSEQFETDLQSRIDEAREVFALNLANIVKQANRERKS